jgi:hypothetical protein
MGDEFVETESSHAQIRAKSREEISAITFASQLSKKAAFDKFEDPIMQWHFPERVFQATTLG